MANDLSKLTPRTTQQDRITHNRDAMFRRQDTEAPRRGYFQDLRNASRGDGGAEALMQALGMVNKGAQSIGQYANDAYQQNEDKAGAQGAVDFATGHVDPAMQQKSHAYRDALTLGRAQKDWSEGLSGFDNEVQQLIQNQTATDPETRKAEINSLLDDYYHRFAVDEQGQVKDFGSPGANKWLAAQMAQTRAVALEQAGAAIDKRMGEESVTNMTATVRAQLTNGQDVDWSTAMSTLLPSVDRKEAMKEMLVTVKDVAMTLEDKDPQRAMRILDGILGFTNTKPAGTDLNSKFDAVIGAAGGAAPAAEAASYVTPFEGFGSIKLSDKMGSAREGGSSHNGEDFPMPVGTSIKAPMGGEVIGSWRNARGGNQVRVKLDDGTIVGFAHLSSREVKVGDRVGAGDEIGKSGNTGKTTGPHLHATAERDGKKVSFSAVFAGAPQGGGKPTTEGVDPAVFDPQKPSEAADAEGPAQVTPPAGAIQLTPEQRVDLLEFRRTFRKQADAAAEQKRGEDQATNAYGFIARVSGIGAYPTVSEVHDAVRMGQIDPRQGATILNTIDSDRRQAESDVRQAQSEAKSDGNDSKEKRAEDAIGSVLGPVYRGSGTVTDASKRLLDIAASEPDVEVRRAILSGAGEELNKVTSLRGKSQEYVHAANTFDEWQQTYVSQLATRLMGRGRTQEQAAALIKQRLDVYATQLGRGDLPPDKVEKYMKIIEPHIDAWFDRTFPRRPIVK